MTTTDDAPNYTRVAPSPDPANGNGKETGNPQGERNAQARVRAREGRSVARLLSAVSDRARDRRVERVKRADRPVDETTPDLWRRQPLSLHELWSRAAANFGAAWSDGSRGSAVATLMFTVLIALPLTAVGYGFAFCSQAPHRAAWLGVGIAAFVAYLILS